MAERNLYNRSRQNQSGQGSSQQSMPNNRRPPMQNDQQSGRRNEHQQYRGQNEQRQYEGRNGQQQGGRRNDQQQYGRQNEQRQYEGRNEQQQGGRRNDQQQYGRQNEQRQYEGRNEQQQGGRRNDQQQYGRQNEQRQYEGRNEQQQGGRRNDQQQYGRQNEQRQYEGRNEQQQGGRRNDQQQYGRQNYQQQDKRRNEQQGGRQNEQQDRRRNEQQDGRRNEQQDGRRNESQQDERRNESQQDGRRNESQKGAIPKEEQGGRTTEHQNGGSSEQQKGGLRNEQQGSRQNDEPVQQQLRDSPPTKSPVKENSSKQNGSKTSCSDLAIPRRADVSKAGTKGRPIIVEANHLPLSFPAKLPIAVHYDVDIVPDKPKSLVIMVMERFKNQFYPKRHPAYDGRKNLYSSSPLPIKNGISCEVKVMEDDRERTFKVTVKEVARIDLNLLLQYFHVTKNGPKTKLPEEAIHCLEVVFRTAAARGCTSVGQSFFTMPRTMMDLGEGMEMYSGVYQSTGLGWKPFLNVDVAHKPFPKCQKIIDLMYEFCGDKSTPENMKKVDKFLRTLKVRYEIPGQSATKRVSRVNQLDKNATDAHFKNDEGVEISVAEYYEKVKNFKLKHPSLPCLWVGNKLKRILYPAELCTLVDNQVTNRTMTPNQTSKMIKYAATSSTVRKNKIMASVKAANYNNDETVREFGIKVSDQFVEIEARVLEPPKLRYAQTAVVPKKGVWRSDKFREAKSINRWAILCVDGRVREGQLQAFADKMIAQGRFVGMNIEQESSIRIVKLSYHRAKDELRRELGDFKDCDLVVVVIPEDKETYGNVKQVAELQVGVLTQCIRSKNIFNLKDTTVANILLKVNAKLNGVNHCLFKSPACLDKPCIIMGADVTHPAPETNGMVPSVAAVTASHDRNAFQYNITWRLQPPTKEIITDLANIVKQHLIFFFRKHNHKPQRIIFFRDGVSEGQFQTVLREEVMAIRKACLMLEKEGTYKPAITFIVVQKRHHTRLFPKNQRDSEDKNLNVPAGTVVDTCITHPTDSDFYLVSHASIQGVARPTKYRKLWDDSNMSEDELQELTYHLCHMFSRCNRSVSYPAPTYYAHLAAARAKVYCDGINLSMNDNLEAMQSKLMGKKEVITDLPMFFV